MRFQGLWIPACAWRFLESGEITTAELLLLVYIDSISSPTGGTWASDQYLARVFHKDVESIQRMVTHLTNLELLINSGWKVDCKGRYRLLQAFWSCREAPKQAKKFKRLPINRPSCQRKIEATDSEGRQLALRFIRILKKHRKLMRAPSIIHWEAEFTRALESRKLEEIEQVLNWYDKNIHRSYIPQLYTAKTFCDGIPRLEAAISRKLEEDGVVDRSERRHW